MREPIDHERCSELLAPFVRHELDPDLAAEVATHLQTCPECSQERIALEALLPGDVSPLTELERAGLRRIVLAEAVPLPEQGPGEAATAPPSRGARLYQVLAAAAVFALIGGFAYLGLGGGMGGGDSAESGSSSSDESRGADREGPLPVAEDNAESAVQGTSSGAGAAGSSLEARMPAPSPTFVADLGLVDEKRLDKLGRSGLPLVMFSRAYRTDDVAQRQTRFIERVADQAPTARGDDIRTCGGGITQQFPNTLLAYAALAEFENRGDILVLAFAWTDEEAGPLERSMVWAWSIGDCDGIPVHYSNNVIRPR